MKTFKQHISEEWFDHTVRNGEIFKNPTPKDMREYINQLNSKSDFAGLLVNNDVYLFTGGLHDDLMQHLQSLSVGGKVVEFRAVLSSSNKIAMINPTGGYVETATTAQRKKLFAGMLKVYKHKILNRYMDGDERIVMRGIRDMFGFERAYSEFDELMKNNT